MKKMNLSEEVEKTLSSFDDMQRASLDANFDEELAQKVAFLPRNSAMQWLRYSAAAMILMTLINGILLMSSYSDSPDPTSDLSSSMLYQAIDYTEFE